MSRSGLLLLAVSAVLTTIANLALRGGLDRAGGFRPDHLIGAVAEFAKLLCEPLFAGGFVLYFVAALIWFRVMAYEPLSTAYPVMVGLIFVMVSIGAFVFFSEQVSVRKIVGLSVILAGIAIASTPGPA